MQETSALYKQLLGQDHYVELSLVVGERGLLIDEFDEFITFGTGLNLTRILVDQGSAGEGYGDTIVRDIKTYRRMFPNDKPSFGNVLVGEIEISMNRVSGVFPKYAQMVPYIRLTNPEKTVFSEWIKKGVYYINTREKTDNDDTLNIMTYHGYDALARAQMDYPSSKNLSYPALDIDIVDVIASAMNVNVDSRTYELMNGGYTYPLPVGYSIEEVLGFLAVPYAGNWVMTDNGELRLVSILDVPKETRLLTDEFGYVITFGIGDDLTRILV